MCGNTNFKNWRVMNPVEVFEGESPVILGQPHGGTFIPAKVASQFNANGLKIADTDWHIHRLYKGLLPQATVVQATFNRYLIDVNRDPSGKSLYPGLVTTELCPTLDFEGQDIYNKGAEPDAQEIESRLQTYHTAYHAAMLEQLNRIKKKYGIVLLFDCHSIRSYLPNLFEGALPELNLGTNNGKSCDSKIEKVAIDMCEKDGRYNYVLNGRFKGGWTTRTYANPEYGIHCIQLEIAQRTYMDEFVPWKFCEDRAEKLQSYLKNLLRELEIKIKKGL